MKNIGGEYAGAITAALFLAEFVGDVPWAHLDIAGTAKADADDAWRVQGRHGLRHAPAGRPRAEFLSRGQLRIVTLITVVGRRRRVTRALTP